MIIVKITGGLGNQLFQYAFGKYLSVKLNTELKFDIQTNYDSSNFTNRSVGLANFNIKLNLASKNEIDEFKYFNNKLFARIERKFVQKLAFLNRSYMVQNSLNPQKNIVKFRNNCYYDGYWQSEDYFKQIANILQQELKSNFNPVLSEPNRYLLNEIRNSESVSIHVRRGDYISIQLNNSLFSICSLKYYEEAINYIKRKIKNPLFFVFSDDIEWAKENLRGDNFIFVTGNEPADDMYLMSLCEHNIIANSTFSWWGAWLNKNSEKIVIAPKQWYNGKLNKSTKDLIPAEWIRI